MADELRKELEKAELLYSKLRCIIQFYRLKIVSINQEIDNRGIPASRFKALIKKKNRYYKNIFCLDIKAESAITKKHSLQIKLMKMLPGEHIIIL